MSANPVPAVSDAQPLLQVGGVGRARGRAADPFPAVLEAQPLRDGRCFAIYRHANPVCAVLPAEAADMCVRVAPFHGAPPVVPAVLPAPASGFGVCGAPRGRALHISSVNFTILPNHIYQNLAVLRAAG